MQRVLVVEDEESVARALERWLKRKGCVVHVELDVGHLEARLAEFDPTHVISDLVMPQRDGLEVLAVVKRLKPAAVRLLLSGSLESLSAEVLALIAPCGLVGKPWDERDLARQLGLETRA